MKLCVAYKVMTDWWMSPLMSSEWEEVQADPLPMLNRLDWLTRLPNRMTTIAKPGLGKTGRSAWSLALSVRSRLRFSSQVRLLLYTAFDIPLNFLSFIWCCVHLPRPVSTRQSSSNESNGRQYRDQPNSSSSPSILPCHCIKTTPRCFPDTSAHTPTLYRSVLVMEKSFGSCGFTRSGTRKRSYFKYARW